jgi:hemolysin-activating ACP:hemolysin acyltransferase
MTAIVPRTCNSTEDAVGRFVCLCEKTGHYLGWTIGDLRRLIFPPIELEQYRFFYDAEEAVAFVSWGLFSQELSDYLLRFRVDPRIFEWKSGHQLWITDFICNANYTTHIPFLVRTSIFNDEFAKEKKLQSNFAYSFRRERDGDIRKIARFYFLKTSSVD